MAFSRFYKNVIKELRHYMSCFIFFHYTFVQSTIVKCRNFYFFDLGFKYLVKVKKAYKFYFLHSVTLKVVKLETLFNEIKVSFFHANNSRSNTKIWLIIKKAFETKSFLTCRILNATKNGFAIGFCGIVGYIPKKYCILSRKQTLSIFSILNIDLFKKTFTLSQKQVSRLVSRCLYKLNSKIKHLQKRTTCL